ncbi:hypothetical protein NLI96_g1379 [Meripilus lineatus]|uniref:Translin n=1 Tax=Meripilus lineatus TaxID=2056292 RepID=A0AAD5VC21_9APHY|nr:hypothetical protein NLI96_g1379 [Physisporinus lineatus]
MSESHPSTSRNAVVTIFDGFRAELDDHNDRRERLIKSSRDVTSLSKKVIFLLHRLMTDDVSSKPDQDDRSRALNAASRAREKLKEIQNLFASFSGEIQGDMFWKYHKNVSPGLQEYIEALSFTHYLETGNLITYDQVQASISDDAGNPYFPLPLEDYLLGLSDLTGELMRYAISAISQHGGRTKASQVCTFVREFRAIAYAIAVRSSEYDIPPDMLDDIVSGLTSNAASGDRTRKRQREDEFDDPDE